MEKVSTTSCPRLAALRLPPASARSAAEPAAMGYSPPTPYPNRNCAQTGKALSGCACGRSQRMHTPPEARLHNNDGAVTCWSKMRKGLMWAGAVCLQLAMLEAEYRHGGHTWETMYMMVKPRPGRPAPLAVKNMAPTSMSDTVVTEPHLPARHNCRLEFIPCVHKR